MEDAMKKIMFVLLALCLLALPVTVMAQQEVDTEATVTVALTTIIDNLDYMIQSTLNASGIFQHMFEPLIDLDPQTVTIVPCLATEWSTSEDGKVWTFKLRDDVKFWDGEPFTAKDVKYTMERMLMDDYNIGNTNYLNNQINFDKAVVVDDHTVEIHTKAPVPALLYSLQEVKILPEHVYSKLTPTQAASEVIMGTGPFKFVEYVKDDYVKMERNDDYWGEKPAFKYLVFRNIPEASTRVAELETGGIDVAQQVPMAQIESVNASGTAHTSAVSNGCRMYMGFNHENPTFTKNVRLAMNYAIDWDAINQSFFYGAVPRMVTNVNRPWLNENLKPYPYDLNKVNELLTADGYVKNAKGFWEKDGKELAPKIMVYYEQTSERYEVLLSIVDMFRKAGINAEPYYLDRAAAFEKLDKREVDDMFYIASCTSYEGQGDITDLKADSASNYGRWNNPEFEALFDQLLVEFDMNKRAELLNKMQEIVYNEAAIIPLYIMIDVWGINNKLEWEPNPTGRALMKSAKKYK
jgi:peptide/nickel transport system substrate-binding protein